MLTNVNNNDASEIPFLTLCLAWLTIQSGNYIFLLSQSQRTDSKLPGKKRRACCSVATENRSHQTVRVNPSWRGCRCKTRIHNVGLYSFSSPATVHRGCLSLSLSLTQTRDNWFTINYLRKIKQMFWFPLVIIINRISLFFGLLVGQNLIFNILEYMMLCIIILYYEPSVLFVKESTGQVRMQIIVSCSLSWKPLLRIKLQLNLLFSLTAACLCVLDRIPWIFTLSLSIWSTSTHRSLLIASDAVYVFDV